MQTRFHRDLPPARVWGFDNSSPGPTIEVRRGQPILVEWVNALPIAHLFTIDHSLHGAGTDVPDVRTIIHVHGLRVAPADDGYPESWYPPGSRSPASIPMDRMRLRCGITITPCPSRGSTSTPAWWGSI